MPKRISLFGSAPYRVTSMMKAGIILTVNCPDSKFKPAQFLYIGKYDTNA